MPHSAALAPLTCLLQLLLWFVLTFPAAQKSVSAPEKPVTPDSHTTKPWLPRREENLRLKEPLLPCHSFQGQKGDKATLMSIPVRPSTEMMQKTTKQQHCLLEPHISMPKGRGTPRP